VGKYFIVASHNSISGNITKGIAPLKGTPFLNPARSAGNFFSKETLNKKFCLKVPPSFLPKFGQGGVPLVISPDKKKIIS
jgi:hypothetical protein